MGATEVRDELASLGLFSGLGQHDLDFVQQWAQVIEHSAGAVVVRQGDEAAAVYVVLAGTAFVTLDGQQIDPPLVTGDCIGQLAVLGDTPRTATVTANSPMRLLALPSAHFHAVLAELPLVRQRLIESLGRRLHDTSVSFAQLAADTEVLLSAFLALQDSGRRAAREDAVRRAAELLERLATLEATAAADPERSATERLHVLTPAQRRVADLVAEGLSNAAIAETLRVSRHTVESHLKQVFVKLDLTSRVSLATLVLRAG